MPIYYLYCVSLWRRTQVGKGRLCKSLIHQFESDRCLSKLLLTPGRSFFWLAREYQKKTDKVRLILYQTTSLQSTVYFLLPTIFYTTGFFLGLPRPRFTGVPSGITVASGCLALKKS